MINGKKLPILAACMAAGLGAAFAATETGQTGSRQVQCEIATKSSGGMTVIEGLAHAQKPLSGTYSLQVSGPGVSIDQGGRFEAAAGEPAVLGSVMLSGGGQRVTLEVTADGQTSSCSRRV